MAVPPRWLNCPRKSQIICDKFLAFKTPLGPRYDSQIPEENRFELTMLLAYIQSMKQTKLGMIIDLTNTNRFYDKSKFERAGIEHVKLQCRGHGETPSLEQTNTFIKICESYWRKHPGELIGVHCTHGFNRTGFLIIAFLIEKEDWSVDAAASFFAQCRPPGIYKFDYLMELTRRYGDTEGPLPVPERPDWCFEDEDAGLSDEGEENGRDYFPEDGSRPDGSRKRRRRDTRIKDAKFVEGISGVKPVESPRCEEIQEICEEMCGWERGGFPGSQPVSMDISNISLIHKKPYRVSWKADGVRYMMLILKEKEIFLIDRDNSVFSAPQFTFPQRKNPTEHVFNTLLDGEMVFDKEGDKVHPRYLVYEIIKFQDQDVGKTPHDTRMTCIQKEIELPRNEAAQRGSLDKASEPFSIRAKNFFQVEKAGWVLDHFVSKVAHETDGLVFNPAEDPYTPGTSDSVLKWKPHTLNSVDFRLNIVTFKQEGCITEKVGCLMVGGLDTPFCKIKVTKELREHDKKVIECTWDGSQWKFLRVREDKSFPNAYNTAQRVCGSIRHPITKEKLLDFIEKHRYGQSEKPNVRKPSQ